MPQNTPFSEWKRITLARAGHIDRMHEAPSDHRRWCHQDDDARPLVAGWIAVTILAASVWATDAGYARYEAAVDVGPKCPSRTAEVTPACATAVLMSGKVWPIWGTDGTVAKRLTASLQVRRYIMSCEQAGNSVAGLGVVSKTSAPGSHELMAF